MNAILKRADSVSNELIDKIEYRILVLVVFNWMFIALAVQLELVVWELVTALVGFALTALMCVLASIKVSRKDGWKSHSIVGEAYMLAIISVSLPVLSLLWFFADF